jgi:hypothetical protein
MPCWVLLKCLFSPDGAFDIAVRNLPFLGEGMSKNGDILTVEEIQNPIVYSPSPGPKLIYAISQVIGLAAPEIMPQFGQASDAGDAFGVAFAV